VKAQAIIDYRNKNGPFKSINDLEKVEGIGPATLEKIRKDVSQLYRLLTPLWGYYDARGDYRSAIDLGNDLLECLADRHCPELPRHGRGINSAPASVGFHRRQGLRQAAPTLSRR